MGSPITPATRARLLLFFAAALFGLLAVLARFASLEGLTAAQVARVYRDIDRKRLTTLPLQLPPALVKPVPEIVKNLTKTP